MLSCGMAKSEGGQGCKGMHACMELTNYHFLNRELVTNEHCCNATQHLDRDHKTYEYYTVRGAEMGLNCAVHVHFNALLNLKRIFD